MRRPCAWLAEVHAALASTDLRCVMLVKGCAGRYVMELKGLLKAKAVPILAKEVREDIRPFSVSV